jgi:glycosyltransferase involved in cell wall biosynthesis
MSPVLRLLIVTPYFYPGTAAGGPITSWVNLVSKHAHSRSISVFTADRDFGASAPYQDTSPPTTELAAVRVSYVNPSRPDFVNRLYRAVTSREVDAVIVTGIWSMRFSLLPCVLASFGPHTAPLFVAPRGDLQPEALLHHAWRKKLVGVISRRALRYCGATLVAASDTEVSACEAWSPKVPVVLGVNVPRTVEFARSTHHPRLRVLVAGRIHPHKGLHHAIAALDMMRHPVHLTICGPVEDPEYWRSCVTALDRVASHMDWEYLGRLSADALADQMRQADVLLQLSVSENFSHVVAEALQAGCSVVVSDSIPWATDLPAEAGIVVEVPPDTRRVARYLEQMAELSDEDGANMRRLARQAFDAWQSRQLPDLIEAIERAIGRGSG